MNGTGHIASAGMKHNEREWGMRITLDKRMLSYRYTIVEYR